MKKFWLRKEFHFMECHGCGHVSIAWPGEEERTTCAYCGDRLVDSGKSMPTRQVKSREREEWQRAREQEIYEKYIAGNSGNEAKYRQRLETQEEDRQEVLRDIERRQQEMERQRQAMQPRCPACGSVNVKETIDLLPVNGSFLRKKYYLCYDCGYKWRRFN